MSKPFKIEQAYEVGRLWRKHFSSLPLSDIYDKELSAMLKEVKIDLDALDYQLALRYPDESENKSMKEIITEHYGKEAMSFIMRLI